MPAGWATVTASEKLTLMPVCFAGSVVPYVPLKSQAVVESTAYREAEGSTYSFMLTRPGVEVFEGGVPAGTVNRRTKAAWAGNPVEFEV